MDDSELVLAALRGERDAYAGIYDRYADHLYDFSAAILRDRQEACDAVRHSFLAAFESLDELADPARLRSWLYAMASRAILDAAPGSAAVGGGVDPNWDPTWAAGDSKERLSRAELAEYVCQCSVGFDLDERVLLDLDIRQGLEGRDLASAAGIPRSAVQGRLDQLEDQIERSLGALLVARTSRRDCPVLYGILNGWDGRLSPAFRAEVTAHVNDCEVCNSRRRIVPSPLTLMASMPLSAAPAFLRNQVLPLAATLAATRRGEGPPAAFVASEGWEFNQEGFPILAVDGLAAAAGLASGAGGAGGGGAGGGGAGAAEPTRQLSQPARRAGREPPTAPLTPPATAPAPPTLEHAGAAAPGTDPWVAAAEGADEGEVPTSAHPFGPGADVPPATRGAAWSAGAALAAEAAWGAGAAAPAWAAGGAGAAGAAAPAWAAGGAGTEKGIGAGSRGSGAAPEWAHPDVDWDSGPPPGSITPTAALSIEGGAPLDPVPARPDSPIAYGPGGTAPYTPPVLLGAPGGPGGAGGPGGVFRGPYVAPGGPGGPGGAGGGAGLYNPFGRPGGSGDRRAALIGVLFGVIVLIAAAIILVNHKSAKSTTIGGNTTGQSIPASTTSTTLALSLPSVAPTTTTIPTVGKLSISAGTASNNMIALGLNQTSASFTVTNTGQAPLDFTAAAMGAGLSVNPQAGSLIPGASQIVTVTLDRTQTAQGNFMGSVQVSSGGGNATISVTATNDPGPTISAVKISPTTVYTASCPAPFKPKGAKTVAGVTATVTGPQSVTEVVLHWEPAGTGTGTGGTPTTNLSTTTTLAGGTGSGGGGTSIMSNQGSLYVGVLGPFTAAGNVSWWITAIDSANATVSSAHQTLQVPC